MHSALALLTKLEVLDVNANRQISGGVSSLSALTMLHYLDLSNTQVSGDLAIATSLKKLSYLAVYDSDFSGSIPNEIGELLSLRSLLLGRDVPTNYIYDYVYQDFSRLDAFLQNVSKLPNFESEKDFFFTKNNKNNSVPIGNFFGELPSSLCKLSNLTVLTLNFNRFESSLPRYYM